MGEGGQSQFINLAQIYRNLPGPQITQKLTLDIFFEHNFQLKRVSPHNFEHNFQLKRDSSHFLSTFDIKMSRVAFTHLRIYAREHL